MRALILAIPAALLLAACGDRQAGQNSAAADQGLASDAVYVNDSTAIDAASGADANMAADVDLNYGWEETDGNAASAGRTRRSGSSTDRNEVEPARPADNVTAPEDGAAAQEPTN